ncbi:hypothetical protein PFAG_05064, partial [Plasmodium falciparum Santa Lucia]
MGGGSGGRGSGEDKYDDAKHMFDRIGQQVHKEVKKDAENYIGELHGTLSSATFRGVESTPSEPCQLNHRYHTNVKNSIEKEYPCRNGTKERFPDKEGAQCHTKKIKDNKGKEGACAPYRRLHICDYNLENINDYGNITNDTLLVDVCQAAKFEGESITRDYLKYQAQYASSVSSSQMCTMLARSFADIGDIVRGRDLYLRDKGKRDKLEEKLKTIFGIIYGKLKNGKTNGQKSAKEYYEDKDTDKNYYKLREDWWNANRQQVWKAITCNAGGYSYFRPTCSEESLSQDKCRCANTDVPTNFDYVPQYLRWFEEWAEDFCRKRKHKLEDAIKKCRGQYKDGKKLYCDLNGYDCEKTKRGRNKYLWDHKCAGCFLSCSHFRTWIDNQRKQFLKQRNKYADEMQKYEKGASSSSGGRRKRSAPAENHEGYEKKFYEQLKEKNNYGTVEGFLGLLNKEEVCKKKLKDDDDKEGIINFKNVHSGKHSSGDSNNKTFSHTTYCQACPWCGVKRNGSGGSTKWERKDNMDECPPKNLYEPIDDKVGTPINFLYSGEGEKDIETKLKAFCTKTQNGSDGSGGGGGGGNSDSQDLYQKWKCYQLEELKKVRNPKVVDDEDGDEVEEEDDLKSAGGLCILKNDQRNEENKANSQNNHADIQKTFNPFFYYWVVHMLKDSIHWRTEKIKGCLENGNRIKCGNQKCEKSCKCFESWVKQKKIEWSNIKEHFGNQEDFKNKGENNGSQMLDDPWKSPDFVLQQVLKKDLLLTSLREAYRNEKDIKHIEELLKEEEAEVAAAIFGGENKTTIDKLLEQELNDAKECLKTYKENCPPKKPTDGGPGAGGVARKLDTQRDTNVDPEQEEEDEDDEEEEEEVEEEAEPEEDTETTEDPPAEVQDTAAEAEVPAATDTSVDVCATVAKALTETNLKQACPTKYDKYGREKFPNWKCVPTSGDNNTRGGVTTTGSSGDTAGSGSICIPPRRRRLYVGHLQKWASGNTQASQVDGEAQPQGEASSQSGVETTVNGASTETTESSLLRDAFIQSAAIETFFLWHRYKKENKPQNTSQLPLQSPLSNSDDPQSKLQKSGDIPNDFLRLMFYTLADYKDIFEGKSIEVGDEKEKQKMKEIQQKITDMLNKTNSGTEAGVPPNSDEQRKKFWETYGENIWNGMICALTHKTETPGEVDKQVETALLEKGNPITKYQYTNAKLEDTSGAKTSQAASPTIDTPLLSEFVLRPPYFRYLEEWGQNFCKERKKRLEDIKSNCLDADGIQKKCSGDGEQCDRRDILNEGLFADLQCPRCGNPCSSYRKWIKGKKTQYEKQKDRYKTEIDQAKSDNEFSTRVQSLSDAAEFLQRLVSCKNNDTGEDNGNENGECKKIFDKNCDTFQHAKYCKPCSDFKINCRNGNCSKDKEEECDRKNSIQANDIGKRPNSAEDIGMVVSDNSKSGNGFKNGLNVCIDAGIFKGFRKDEWKCVNICGYDVCGLKIENNKNYDQIILINALLKRWLEYFFEDYNKIQKKLKACTKSGKGSTCIRSCVDEWIKLKKNEWNNINATYLKQYTEKNPDGNNLTKFLEQYQHLTEFKNAIKPCDGLTQFEKSKQCNAAANSQNGGANKRDVVECLLDKLENLKNKIKTCQNEHDKNSVQISDKTQTACENSAHVEDDEEDLLLEETEEVKAPNICPAQTPEPEKEEDECKAASPAEPEQAAEKPAAEKPAAEKPAAEKPAAENPSKPAPEPPTLSDQPTNSISDILSSTIPFGIAIALTSIVFLFLK